MKSYYDFQEYWTLRDKIAWSPDEKIKWSDFKNDEYDGYFAQVGLSTRYNVNDPILFRSKTVFIPKGSYTSDTTDLIKLRTAQMKFDLLEFYRRNMVLEVDSIRNLRINNYTTSDFEELGQKYYDLFDLEWEKHLAAENELESLIRLEKRIKFLLK